MLKFIQNGLQAYVKPGVTKAMSDPAYTVINGGYNASNTTISMPFKINGTATLGPHLTVNKSMVVNGQLNALSVLFLQALMVNGGAFFEKIKAQSMTTVNGNASVRQSYFSSLFILMSQQMHASDSHFHSILIKKYPFFHAKQTIHLTNTIVEGDITFESGDGTVICDQQSHIKGILRGGVMR